MFGIDEELKIKALSKIPQEFKEILFECYGKLNLETMCK